MRFGERSRSLAMRSGQSRHQGSDHARRVGRDRQGKRNVQHPIDHPTRRERHAARCRRRRAGPAQAVSIDVGSYSNTGLGAEFVTSYDTFTITGDSVSIAMPQAPLAFSLGTFWFEVGPNCYSCTLTPSFDAVLDVSVLGETQQLHIPYAWYSSGPNDYLTFSQAAPLMFDFGNQGLLMITLDAIATLVSPGGKVYGDLYATASVVPGSVTPVPEPASYALMLAGLGVIGFVARRRRG